MCLAVPALLVKCDGINGAADLHGNRVPICTALVPEAVAGDWILIHAGFAIQKLDVQDAMRTFAVLDDLDRCTAADAGRGVT
jgi:hydrogenase expression/formation protein HypC